LSLPEPPQTLPPPHA